MGGWGFLRGGSESGAPTANGLIAAGGRLFLALTDGSVVCMHRE